MTTKSVIDVVNGWIQIEPPVQALVTAFYNNSRPYSGGPLYAPLNKENIIITEAVCPENVDVEYTEKYIELRNEVMKIDRSLTDNTKFWLSQSKFDPDLLKPHQIDVCSIGTRWSKIFNASGPGIGKTRSSYGLLSLWQRSKAVVVAPSSVLTEWWNENCKISAGWDVYCIGETTTFPCGDRVKTTLAERKKLLKRLGDKGKTLIVVNYEAIDTLSAPLYIWGPDVLIADESWFVTNPKAKRTCAVQHLAKLIPYTILMTGTPFGSNVGGLWSQGVMTGVINENSFTYDDFCSNFVTYKDTYIGKGKKVPTPFGVKNAGQMMSIFQDIWYRVVKEVVLDLPEKVYSTVFVDSTKEVEEALDRAYLEINDELHEDLTLSSSAIMIMREQQITGGHVGYIGNDEKGHSKEIPSPKLDWLCEWCKQNLIPYPTRRLVVWSRFRTETIRICRELSKVLGGRVFASYGGSNNAELDKAKVSFNSRSCDPKSIQVLSLQIDKNNAGHNLQSGDVHVFFSNSYNPIYRIQAEDRSHREGRVGMCQYIDLMIRDTADLLAYTSVMRKINLSSINIQNIRKRNNHMGRIESNEEIMTFLSNMAA